MPVHPVKGQPGCYQWGESGKVYCGDGAKEKAEAQGRAAYASGYKGKAEMQMPMQSKYQEGDDRWWLFHKWEVRDDKTLMTYQDNGRFKIWVLLNPYHFNGRMEQNGKLTFICTTKHADAKEECLNWISANLPEVKGKSPFYARKDREQFSIDKQYYSVEFDGLTYREEGFGRKRLDGYAGFGADEAKKNFTTIEESDEMDLESFREGLYHLYLKGKITEAECAAWSDDYEAFLQGEAVEKPPFAAETFEAESKPNSVEISRSSNPEKKLMAVFSDKEGNKIKTTHFGQRGASDYTKHGDRERMERYLERHGGGTTTSTKEDWKDPTTAGSLSRWILWNKPSLSGSFSDYKRRFGLKGTMKVSKSAEQEGEKEVQGRGIYFFDPASPTGLSHETLFLKDGSVSRYGTPKKDKIAIPDRMKKIMEDIGTTDFGLKESTGSALWIYPQFRIEEYPKGRQFNPVQGGLSDLYDAELIKVLPATEEEEAAWIEKKKEYPKLIEEYEKSKSEGRGLRKVLVKQKQMKRNARNVYDKEIVLRKFFTIHNLMVKPYRGRFANNGEKFSNKPTHFKQDEIDKAALTYDPKTDKYSLKQKGRLLGAEGKLSSAQKSLNKWTKEDWGTKSGKPSTQGKDATGERYLPRKAREALTDKEYARTSAKKRRDTAKGKQFSPQPDDVEEKVKKYRSETFEAEKPLFHNVYCTLCGQDFQSVNRKWETMGKARKQQILSSWIQKHYQKKHPEEYKKWFDFLYKNGYDAAYHEYGLPVDTKEIFEAEQPIPKKPKKEIVMDFYEEVLYDEDSDLFKMHQELNPPNQKPDFSRWDAYNLYVYSFWKDEVPKRNQWGEPLTTKDLIWRANHLQRKNPKDIPIKDLSSFIWALGGGLRDTKLEGMIKKTPPYKEIKTNWMSYKNKVYWWSGETMSSLNNDIVRERFLSLPPQRKMAILHRNWERYRDYKLSREELEKLHYGGLYEELRMKGLDIYVPQFRQLDNDKMIEIYEKQMEKYAEQVFEAIEGKGSKARFTDQPDPKIYRDTGLRQKARNDLLKGTKGGDAGEWSARKAQMAATRYRTLYENKYGEGKNPYF